MLKKYSDCADEITMGSHDPDSQGGSDKVMSAPAKCPRAAVAGVSGLAQVTRVVADAPWNQGEDRQEGPQ